MTSEEITSQGIQSVEVGIDILKKIAGAGKPLTITEIAVLCDTSKSKLHRYLTSFIKTGILDKSQDAKYTLGTELILLGLKASQKLSIQDIAAQHLLDIKEILNETAALAIWGENGPFFVRWEENNRPINIGIKSGSQVSLTTSATGRVFAAFLPNKKIEKIINEELANSSITQEQFQNIIEITKKERFSFVNSSFLPGISALACPIFDSSSNIVAALTVVGLESTLDTSDNSKAVQLLKEKANLLSKLLGWNEQ